MQQMIEKLKAKRQELIEATEQVSVAETRLKKTERYQELQRAKDVLFNVSTELDALENLFRQSAIDYFEKTGDKNPVDGQFNLCPECNEPIPIDTCMCDECGPF